ncbi:hypothetical protein DY000_02042159 [Brassica cretica]|uniref:Uncharacterized protein n=1 Tax=Brassica cretica TaxID=69181 RepID=A0ABQ7B7I7_BRACR|nr:hypothetical protein DY000_02042159 [Brassica cretica]
MESTSRGGETYKEASKSDIRNSQGLMEVGGHLKKKNCWTFFAAAAQVYGRMIHESVESVEMISSYEIRAASIRKKCFRAVLDLQSQGVCDYMHWSLGFLHVLQVIGTESIVEHNGFRTGLVWDCLKIHSLSHVILGTRAYEGETNGSTGYHGCRAAVQSDVQGKVYIQIATKEIIRMRSLVSTGY